MRLILTCEHGGNRVPLRYRSLFVGSEEHLATHRGYDAGALTLLRRLARETNAPYFTRVITRLLVDANRNERNPAVFSEFTRSLPTEERQRILERYHYPYRERVAKRIETLVDTGARALHLSIHSFTPEWDGVSRNAEVGLLYDPTRELERAFCHRWKDVLRPLAPHWRIRMNYPYKGTSDGLTSALRRRFPESNYLGIELEINQALVFASKREWRESIMIITRSLRDVLDDKGR